ncbi:hypothetical protein Godav_013763 [Gossypium davidsonii]|uniref:Uncharacterized protein n=1 Tax=Gossypium davidsonii TaxID=34287 RepID=A0A7J8RHL3_GOSDV|nr:hypothetical protein [Gossypium davidsonii]
MEGIIGYLTKGHSEWTRQVNSEMQFICTRLAPTHNAFVVTTYRVVMLYSILQRGTYVEDDGTPGYAYLRTTNPIDIFPPLDEDGPNNEDDDDDNKEEIPIVPPDYERATKASTRRKRGKALMMEESDTDFD